MTLAIGLLVLAFVLVMMELTFPSFGLLSLGAATAYAFALVRAFERGANTGWTFVVLGVGALTMLRRRRPADCEVPSPRD